MSSDIKARGTFAGQEIKDIIVLNPGGWFGKAWLLEIGGSYWPLFLVVESDSISDAIDELPATRSTATTSSSPRKTSATTQKTNGTTQGQVW